LEVVADINPVAAAYAARKFGASKAISNYREILEDPAIHAVFITVGHNLHAKFVCEVLENKKHVFVEKPLALNEAELTSVIRAAEQSTGQILMVGFNRRFSPHTHKIKKLLEHKAEPLCMTMTVNAGFIPPEHWVQDPARGGGRIIGEGCHFIDLLSYLAGSPITSVSSLMIGGGSPVRDDKMSILLGFKDGSVGTVHYFANGSKSYPKETLEIFSDGRVIRMENFRSTTGYGFKGFRSFRTWRQDKGHVAELTSFLERVASGGEQLIPIDQLINVTRASFAAVEAAKTGKVISLA
jgi:predicted dehydrogenase